MGRDTINLSQMLQGGGRIWELGRTAIQAILNVEGTMDDARPLWSPDFQSQVADVLMGKAKIVQKTPEEIVRTNRRSWNERMAAIEQISSQEILQGLATDLGIDFHYRRAAFNRVQDEKFIADYAMGKDGDATDERLLSLNDGNLLYELAMSAYSSHVSWWASRRLIEVDIQKAFQVAITHEANDFHLGTMIAEEARKLEKHELTALFQMDQRTPARVRQAATGRS
jgi:ribosomal protein L17